MCRKNAHRIGSIDVYAYVLQAAQIAMIDYLIDLIVSTDLTARQSDASRSAFSLADFSNCQRAMSDDTRGSRGSVVSMLDRRGHFIKLSIPGCNRDALRW